MKEGLTNTVADQLDSMIQDCLDKGFKLPLFVSLVDANGAMVHQKVDRSKKFKQGWSITLLTDYFPKDRGFKMPLHVSIIDKNGVHNIGIKWTIEDLEKGVAKPS